MEKSDDLFRRVRNIPLYLKEDGSISSAIYKDSKGVSMDEGAERFVDDIIADEQRLHELYNVNRSDEERNGAYRLVAIAGLDKENCKEKNVYIESAPIENENPYHVLLKKNKDEIVLTSSQCKYLSKRTRVVKSYDPRIKENIVS